MHGEESPFCWANEGAANSAPAAISRVSFRVLIVFSCPFAELADHVVVVGEVRIEVADAIDFFELAGREILIGIETPTTFE